jgi:hypothetical protein
VKPKIADRNLVSLGKLVERLQKLLDYQGPLRAAAMNRPNDERIPMLWSFSEEIPSGGEDRHVKINLGKLENHRNFFGDGGRVVQALTNQRRGHPLIEP